MKKIEILTQEQIQKHYEESEASSLFGINVLCIYMTAKQNPEKAKEYTQLGIDLEKINEVVEPLIEKALIQFADFLNKLMNNSEKVNNEKSKKRV